MDYCEGICQGCGHRSRTKVGGSKTVRFASCIEGIPGQAPFCWRPFPARRSNWKGGCYDWKPSSSSNFSILVVQAHPLIETRQAVPCRSIRGNCISVDSTLLPLLSTSVDQGEGVVRDRGAGAVIYEWGTSSKPRRRRYLPIRCIYKTWTNSASLCITYSALSPIPLHIVHYEHMALAKKTSMLRAAMLLFVEPHRGVL